MKVDKIFKYLSFWVIFMCLLLLTGCKDARIQGDYIQKYSKEEIKLMMRYHGALVAKFDGKQWWCLQGKRWIRIDSARAAKFAQLKLRKRSSNL